MAITCSRRNWLTSPNFGLFTCAKLKYCTFFVPNFQENLPFWQEIAFSINLRPIQRHGSQKSDLTVKNGIFQDLQGMLDFACCCLIRARSKNFQHKQTIKYGTRFINSPITNTKIFPPPIRPIRCKTKTNNHDLVTCVFPRLALLASVSSVFSLFHCVG